MTAESQTNSKSETWLQKICIDTSMSGLEDGAIRTYIDTAPSITAREYKEPRMILEGLNGSNRQYIHRVTAAFQRGVYPIARCVKAEKHDLGVVMANVNVLGSLEAKFESTNRIYDVGGAVQH